MSQPKKRRKRRTKNKRAKSARYWFLHGRWIIPRSKLTIEETLNKYGDQLIEMTATDPATKAGDASSTVMHLHTPEGTFIFDMLHSPL